ncbi:MBL fold metallo-hydrolase [uncultured Methylobacterium sp.]|uniref:MBL fold metallo-hydrolase n=1 Tax=uncultured Methylobacterium sp. TaxID=157278 RepID=UPI0035CBBB1F
MSGLVDARLVNGPSGDPGVYLDFRFSRRALLFDVGDLAALSPRELMRVSHAFVSHAHMDHVAGLDRLLRLCLHRPEPLHLVGPDGFAERVEHRLHGYTWNLLGDHSPDFRVRVDEFMGGRLARAAEFHARERFDRREAAPPDLPPGTALADEALSVEAVELDHGTPSLAFALVEPERVNLRPEALARLGLAPGPWLGAAKRMARQGSPPDTPVPVAAERAMALGDLAAAAFQTRPGQRVAYVTDAADTPENAVAILALAAGADTLFIEAVFTQADRAAAERTHHLTAGRAGALARAAGARRAVPFHHSARYGDDPGALIGEFHAAYADGATAPTAR